MTSFSIRNENTRSGGGGGDGIGGKEDGDGLVLLFEGSLLYLTWGFGVGTIRNVLSYDLAHKYTDTY